MAGKLYTKHLPPGVRHATPSDAAMLILAQSRFFRVKETSKFGQSDVLAVNGLHVCLTQNAFLQRLQNSDRRSSSNHKSAIVL